MADCCRFECVEPERRRDAHDQHENGQRRKDGELRRSADRARAGRGERAFRSVEESLHQPEHVSRAQDDAERGGDGPAAADAGEGAGENDEFADEAVEHGQADHGERGDDEVGCGAGQLCGESAICSDLTGGVAKFERAEEQEDRGVDDAVSQDLVDGAGPCR